MTLDELIRAFCYFLVFPAFIFFGLIAYNRKQFLVAFGHFLLAAFFFLLLTGLVVRHYYQPVLVLLHLNTAVVAALTFAVTWRATAVMVAGLCHNVTEAFLFPEVEYD